MAVESSPAFDRSHGWPARRIGDICTIVSGGTPPKSHAEYWAGDLPWASGKDLKKLRLRDTIDHVTRQAAEAHSRIAPAGSVLVLVRGMGLANGFAVSLLERPMAFNQDLKAIIPSDAITGAFLMYALMWAGDRVLQNVSDAAHGTKRLAQDDILQFELSCPPKEEQVAITSALDVVQAAIDVESQAVHLSEELKRAVMRQLFSRGLRGEPQKDSEIGPIPESWNLTTFAAVREWLQYGTSVRCSSEPAEYPVLRIPNVGCGTVNADNLKYCGLPTEEANKYLLREGDLLFIRTNGVLDRLGSCAVYGGSPARALFASYIIRARLQPEVEPKYIAYFYGSEPGTALVAGRATPAADGKYNLNTGTIESLPLLLPPTRDDQREVIAILDGIERQIAVHRRKRALLDRLFKSLLQKLMAGEVRASDLNLPELSVPNEASL